MWNQICNKHYFTGDFSYLTNSNNKRDSIVKTQISCTLYDLNIIMFSVKVDPRQKTICLVTDEAPGY